MRPAAARLLQALVTVASAAVTTSAHAEGGGYVIPGFLVTPTFGHVPAVAWGAELSIMAYDSRGSDIGFGGFAQAQSYVGDAPTHGRYAFGLQAGWMFGGELGIALREGAGRYAPTTGVQFGPYGSLGILELGLRFVVPVEHTNSGQSYGFEGGLDIAIKLPVPWGDPPPELWGGHGRPLRVESAVRVAALVRSAEWG